MADEQEDIAALRALDQAYATEWIEGDADGVMALFYRRRHACAASR